MNAPQERTELVDTATDVNQASRDAGSNLAATELHAGAGSTLQSTSTSSTWELPGGRYRVLDEIARGGMGVVLRAMDLDFERPLAIKVMLSGADSESRKQRFLEEARITGQLQHPGIPPVYEMGRLADGRPLLAMKLIEGRTLAELLAVRPDPKCDLSRFLKIFEQVAQTLAYVHSQGVIHRDLKPANIMVGAFGEVQVMDWGLAVRLRRADGEVQNETTADVGTLHSALCKPQSDSRLTQAGEVLGTLAFMPPEQARGEIESLDERADVFGLGAILCVILTGQPPHAGRVFHEVFRRAQQGDLTDALARLGSCGVDEELLALAKGCLAPKPDDRPRHAGDVAARLTAYLESVEARLRQAEIERAQAQLKAQEERKRRRLTLAWSLAAAITVSLAAGGWLWFENQLALRESEHRQSVLTAVDKANDLTAQLRWDDAQLVLDQAARQLGDEGSPDLKQRLDQARREARLLADLDAARLASAQATGVGTMDGSLTAAAYERAFAAFGINVLEMDPGALPGGLLSLRPELRTAIALAMDDWAANQNDAALRDRLHALAGSLDDDPWRQRLRQAKDLDALLALEQDTRTTDLPVVSLNLLAQIYRSHKAYGPSTRVMRRAVRQHPADFWAQFQLATHLVDLPNIPSRLEERISHYRAAVAARPQAAVAHNNLALNLDQKGDVDGAIAAFRQAAKADPRNAAPHINLSSIFQSRGRLAEALAAINTAIEVDPTYAPAYLRLGLILRAKNDLPGAIAAYRQAIEKNPNYSEAYTNLGTALVASGDEEGGIASYRKAISANPKNARAHYNLGNSLRTRGDQEGAEEAYRKAIDADGNLAEGYINLSLVLEAQGRFVDSLAARRRGEEIGSKRPNWQKPAEGWEQEAERLAQLESALPDVLSGKRQPSSQEDYSVFLRICSGKKLHAEALRLYESAVARYPEFASNLENGHRYNAACNAVLAATSKSQHKLDSPASASTTAANIDEPQAAAWRQQALQWLRAELDAWSMLASKDASAKETSAKILKSWQSDPDLASVRDQPGLSQLPPDEQQVWQQFWTQLRSAAP